MKGKKRIELLLKVNEINALVSLGFLQKDIATFFGVSKSTLWSYVGSEKERMDKLLFQRWKCTYSRCYNEKDESFINYGAKGIDICKEWHNFDNYKEWAYANGYSKETPSLNRKNQMLGYCSENCNFVNNLDQQRTGKSSVKFTKEKAEEVRKLYSTGNYTRKQLCELFGVKWVKNGGTIIHDILNNRSWV